jgi:ElaB/YqjD/DUF883 family membrane-anchored ribosome-binding protein
MEVYYKDLISEEASLDKLVDDLMLVVQGATEFADAAGANLAGESKAELATRLENLRESCRRVKGHIFAGARATDKFMRENPYSFIGIGFAAGLLMGVLLKRSNNGDTTQIL